MNRKAAQWLTAASLAAATLAGAPGTAAAQETADSVSVDGKGIVGGALLGGEVVMLTMGAVGVERAWPYLVFGGLGAVGGGIGGYFIESSAPPAEVPLYMLAGGMALVIPTLVVTLNATAYRPPATDQSEPVSNEPSAEPPQGGATIQLTSDAASALRKTRKQRPPALAARAPAPPGLGLIDITPARVAFGLPAPTLRPLYSQAELFKFRLEQGQELRFPVLRASF